MTEDKDRGYQFVFSGTGGKLRCANSQNLNVDRMTHSQVLSTNNMALALTCNAPVNEQFGAKAYNWRKSRPIRVCRSSKRSRTHLKFAPKAGIRYDGLYKVVKYWPHRGNLISQKQGLKKETQQY